MQREHAKVYFQSLLEKKNLLFISSLSLKSITISVFLDLMIQKNSPKKVSLNQEIKINGTNRIICS
jgi:hypothetical protein